MKSRKLRVSFVQFDFASADPKKNKIELLDQIAKITSHKNNLTMLPEMCLGGPSTPSERANYVLQYGDFLENLQRLSKKHRIGFYGSAFTKSGKKYFNTAFFIDDGKVDASYNKLHLFRFNNEHKSFEAGSKIKIFNTQWGKVAPLICYDLRFPELLRAQVFRGATVALVCAQWPESRREHWLALLKARAIENQIFVIAVNRTGNKQPKGAQKKILGPKKMTFAGDSCVISPWGEELFRMQKFAKQGYVTLNLNEVQNVRKQFPFLKDAFKNNFKFNL